jgi:hypothetical protein
MKILTRFALLLIPALGTVSITFAASVSQASILFGPSFSYTTSKVNDQTGFAGGNSNSNQLLGEGKLGILIEGTVLYIGGLYSYQTTSGDTKVTGNYYGPSIGLFDGAFALIGTYVLGGGRSYTLTGGEAKLNEASGYRVDMSYVAGIGSAIGVGPQLTYRDIKFAKSTPVGGTEASNPYQESGFYPSIVFWFRF